ncbi:hypothetical protein O181_070287 [Austropuccinia psidii MF-1]|uniref:GRIP domain-containing protein n=1 Tax=Austropuccinia psidii MF-1 TaxID=1389203 RepID=A0A9Q3F2W9_9BASI|nr:hypothetical protein [Austropuccinia psidii MF-1]
MAHIPLPPSPTSSSTSLNPSPSPPPPQLSSHRDQANDVGTPSIDLNLFELIFQSLVPIISGQSTLLSLHQTLNQLTQNQPSLPLHTSQLLEILNERHDQLDRLRVCDTAKELNSDNSPSLKLHSKLELNNAKTENDNESDETSKLVLEQLQSKLKQEEEKRAKSISLLRAVRQKLVQVEKDKAALETTFNQTKADKAVQIEELQREKKGLENELSRQRITHDQQVSKLRHSFERDTQSLKAHFERDSAAKKSQAELDIITLKAAHERELTSRNQKISQLELRLRELSNDRDKLFDQLQTSQAELETIVVQNDEIKGNSGELEHQLNQSRNRVHALMEEIDQLGRLKASYHREENGLQKLMDELEQQHSTKISSLTSRITQLEKERTDVENELGDNLKERLEEIERLRAEFNLKSLEYTDSIKNITKRNEEILKSQEEIKSLRDQLKAVEQARSSQSDLVLKSHQELENLRNQLKLLTETLEEKESRESQLKSQVEKLKDEMRNVEGVKELLRGTDESKRFDGVGYFSNFSNSSKLFHQQELSNENNREIHEIIDKDGTENEESKDARSLNQQEEPFDQTNHENNGHKNHDLEAEVNFEYLRNTLLQFLEHKEMRPHLVRVLGVILHFTPQETRRLAAKV